MSSRYHVMNELAARKRKALSTLSAFRFIGRDYYGAGRPSN
jgi:hypothetical protein